MKSKEKESNGVEATGIKFIMGSLPSSEQASNNSVPPSYDVVNGQGHVNYGLEVVEVSTPETSPPDSPNNISSSLDVDTSAG